MDPQLFYFQNFESRDAQIVRELYERFKENIESMKSYYRSSRALLGSRERTETYLKTIDHLEKIINAVKNIPIKIDGKQPSLIELVEKYEPQRKPISEGLIKVA